MWILSNGHAPPEKQKFHQAYPPNVKTLNALISEESSFHAKCFTFVYFFK